MSTLIMPGVFDISPCPWCENDGLFYFDRGAVCCDNCQCEGPWAQDHFEGKDGEDLRELQITAVMLWNARGEQAYEDMLP